MKKAIVLLSACLVGCVTAPTETIFDPGCEPQRFIKVTQVLDNGVIAEISGYDSVFIRMNPEPLETMYDGLNGELYKDSCLFRDGTIQYETIFGAKRTIPQFNYTNGKIPNPAYAEWLEKQDK